MTRRLDFEVDKAFGRIETSRDWSGRMKPTAVVVVDPSIGDLLKPFGEASKAIASDKANIRHRVHDSRGYEIARLQLAQRAARILYNPDSSAADRSQAKEARRLLGCLAIEWHRTPARRRRSSREPWVYRQLFEVYLRVPPAIWTDLKKHDELEEAVAALKQRPAPLFVAWLLRTKLGRQSLPSSWHSRIHNGRLTPIAMAAEIVGVFLNAKLSTVRRHAGNP